jgi:hypothetical protein
VKSSIPFDYYSRNDRVFEIASLTLRLRFGPPVTSFGRDLRKKRNHTPGKAGLSRSNLFKIGQYQIPARAAFSTNINHTLSEVPTVSSTPLVENTCLPDERFPFGRQARCAQTDGWDESKGYTDSLQTAPLPVFASNKKAGACCSGFLVNR